MMAGPHQSGPTPTTNAPVAVVPPLSRDLDLPTDQSPHFIPGRFFQPLAMTLTTRARSIRVTTLLVGIALMSFVDLGCTLAYASNVGMIEANPIARTLMNSHGTVAVVFWKLFTLLVALIPLFLVRRTRCGELATWAGFLVLLALSLHWIDFNRDASELGADYKALAVVEEHRWAEIPNEQTPE